MKKQKKALSSLQEFWTIISWTLKFYYSVAPFKTTGLLIGRISRDISSLIYGFFFAKIIDQIIELISSPNASLDLVYKYLIALTIFGIVSSLLTNTVYQYCRRTMRNISRLEMDRFFYMKLNSLGIQNLEDPQISNKIKRAGEWVYDTLYVVEESVAVISSMVVVIASALILLNIFPLIVPILIVINIIAYIPQQHYNRQTFEWQVKNTEGQRMARNNAAWLGDAKSLLEINLNNSFSFFDDKYKNFMSHFNKGLTKYIKGSEATSGAFDVINELVSFFVYIFLIAQAIAGTISVGTILFTTRAVDSFTSQLSHLMSSITSLYDFALKMSDLVYIFNLQPAVKDGTIKLPTNDIPPSVEFKNVTFAYPRSKKNIFEHLNLHIKSGEKIAIVGHNGAGKTTLIKLIARVYGIKSGSIFVDGVDLKKVKIESWYKKIGVLFQEYNFYRHLSVKENIQLGDPTRKLDEKQIVDAAISADADEFIMDYSKGYDTIMSEQFEEGISPSGGQKQKIAIARFFYRNAPLAIFDEPTSAIDAVSEYKIFNRIYSFFENKTVIIVSHRFSTVRNADRIIVMDHGKIVEEGTHDELLKKNGTYAHAFKLQAEGYKTNEK